MLERIAEGRTDVWSLTMWPKEFQDREWTPAAPAIVRGKVENLTEGSLEVHVQPILYLSSKTSSAERDRYWAPFDLFRDSPLLTDTRPMDEKGEVVAIKALPVKLTFNKKGVLSWHYQGVADVITTSAS